MVERCRRSVRSRTHLTRTDVLGSPTRCFTTVFTVVTVTTVFTVTAAIVVAHFSACADARCVEETFTALVFVGASVHGSGILTITIGTIGTITATATAAVIRETPSMAAPICSANASATFPTSRQWPQSED